MSEKAKKGAAAASTLGLIVQRRQEVERRAKLAREEEKRTVERYVDDLLRKPRAEIVRQVTEKLGQFLEMKPLPQAMIDQFVRDAIAAIRCAGDGEDLASDADDGDATAGTTGESAAQAGDQHGGQDGSQVRGGGSVGAEPVLPLRRGGRAAAAPAGE